MKNLHCLQFGAQIKFQIARAVFEQQLEKGKDELPKTVEAAVTETDVQAAKDNYQRERDKLGKDLESETYSSAEINRAKEAALKLLRGIESNNESVLSPEQKNQFVAKYLAIIKYYGPAESMYKENLKIADTALTRIDRLADGLLSDWNKNFEDLKKQYSKEFSTMPKEVADELNPLFNKSMQESKQITEGAKFAARAEEVPALGNFKNMKELRAALTDHKIKLSRHEEGLMSRNNIANSPYTRLADLFGKTKVAADLILVKYFAKDKQRSEDYVTSERISTYEALMKKYSDRPQVPNALLPELNEAQHQALEDLSKLKDGDVRGRQLLLANYKDKLNNLLGTNSAVKGDAHALEKETTKSDRLAKEVDKAVTELDELLMKHVETMERGGTIDKIWTEFDEIKRQLSKKQPKEFYAEKLQKLSAMLSTARKMDKAESKKDNFRNAVKDSVQAVFESGTVRQYSLAQLEAAVKEKLTQSQTLQEAGNAQWDVNYNGFSFSVAKTKSGFNVGINDMDEYARKIYAVAANGLSEAKLAILDRRIKASEKKQRENK